MENTKKANKKIQIDKVNLHIKEKKKGGDVVAAAHCYLLTIITRLLILLC